MSSEEGKKQIIKRDLAVQFKIEYCTFYNWNVQASLQLFFEPFGQNPIHIYICTTLNWIEQQKDKNDRSYP